MKIVYFLAVIIFSNLAMADDIFHTDYYNRVVKMYKEEISKNPKDIEIYYKLALAYRALDEYDKAIEVYKKIEKEKPTAKVYYNLALSYEDAFKYKEAVKYIQKAIKLDKNNEKYLKLLKESSRLLGIEYIRDKEYKEAIDIFNLNLKYNPDNESAYFNLGYSYQKSKRFKEAIEAYKKALIINDKDDYTHYNLGVVYLDINRPKMAIESLIKAIEIKENFRYYSTLAFAYSEVKDIKKAKLFYKKSIKSNPKFGSAYLNLFELNLINNITQDKKLEDKFLKYNHKDRRSLAIFDILKILNGINSSKEVDLDKWAKEYKGISLKGYRFNYIDKWIGEINDKAKQDRLKKAVEFFKSNTEQKDRGSI